MYLHLGADVAIRSKDIIGIFDYKLVDHDSFKEFMEGADWAGNIVEVLESSAKSVVVTDKKVYLAPVSKATLVRRCRKNYMPFSILMENEV